MTPFDKLASREFVLGGLTIIISVVISLYSVETYLRHTYHVSDLVAGYYPLGNSVAGAQIQQVQREYSIQLKFNDQGFRDRPFSFERGDERRILFLGDSFVEGTGVSIEKRASSLVERDLQKNYDNRFRVINAGQLATNPISYFENFIQFGVALKPELVVVGVFMGNDFQNSRASPVPKKYSIAEKHISRGGAAGIPNFLSFGYLRAFISGIRSGIPQLVKNELNDEFWNYYFKEAVNRDFYVQKSGLSPARYKAFESLLSPDVVRDFYTGKLNPAYLLGAIDSHEDHAEQLYDANDMGNVVDIIRVMNDECIRRGIKFVVVAYPDLFQVAPERYSRHLIDTLHMKKTPKRMQQLKAMRLEFINNLAQNGIEHIDLTPVLRGDDYYLFDGHLNESGQAVAAQLIYDRLRNQLSAGMRPH